MTFLPSIVCWTRDSTVWVSTSIGSFSISGLSDFCTCVNVSSGSVWHGKWLEKRWKLNEKFRILRRYHGNIRGWSGRIFYYFGSVSCFNRNWLLWEVSRWRSGWCWSKCLGQQFREQIGLQWLITVRKESESEIGYYFGKRVNYFTWAVDGLILRSLFPVMVF